MFLFVTLIRLNSLHTVVVMLEVRHMAALVVVLDNPVDPLVHHMAALVLHHMATLVVLHRLVFHKPWVLELRMLVVVSMDQNLVDP